MKNENKSRFEFTTQRPVAILMIVLGIAVFGYVSYMQLSWDLMPEISYPSFTVRTEYPGAAPEEVENVVSRPLEEQLSLIKDLVSITSLSRPEQSDIILEFGWDASLDRSAQEIREKLDQVFLDMAVEKPMILRYDPSLDPVLRIGIVSDIPLIDLRLIVEDEIARELEALPGVAAARVKGGFEKEILVKLDEKQLAATKIRFNEITSRLMQENVNLAGGNIKEGETEYIVRTLNEFRSVKEIGDIIVTKREGIPVRLKDIAEISYSHKEREVITRVNKLESIEIDIHKEADANIVEVAQRVKDRLFGTPEQQQFTAGLTAREEEKEKAKEEGKEAAKEDSKEPKEMSPREKRLTNYLKYRLENGGMDIQYHILADQSIFIENSINEVKNTAVIGGILAIVILFLFLRNFGTTLIVAVSIPLSVIAAFAPLKLFNVSLNIMSLGGLALGIGMLVDNSIVVIESIFRCREEGDGWVESAVRGVSEVGGAVMASTLTTIAVFFPIVFVEGVAGQIFGDLSLAVVFSLLASLMVSLFFIPMLASRKFKKTTDLSLAQFAFSFKKERTAGNFARILIEAPIFILTLGFHALLMAFYSFLSMVVVFLYPLLALLGIHNWLVRFVKTGTEDNLPLKDKVLWPEFMVMTPLHRFVESMRQPQSEWEWAFITFKWLYCIFRFLVNGFMFFFGRLFLVFAAIVLIFFKAFFIFGLAWIVPVAKGLTSLFGKFLEFINKYYPRLLATALKQSAQVIMVVLLLFVFTIFVILPRIGSELIPEVHQGTLYVNVTFPVGTPVEKNDRLQQEISSRIEKLPQVQSISFYSGTTKEELQEDEVGEHIGKITIVLEKSRDIQATEETVIAAIREELSNFTDLDYNISRPVLFTMKPPIEVVINGYNLPVLRRISSEIYQQIAEIPGLKDVQSSVKPGFPELVVEFDRMRLSHYGMNAYDVASLIKNKIEGTVPTKYKEKDKRVDIRVYLKDDQRRRAENIRKLIINPGGAVPIPLDSVANVSILSGPNEIRRVDQERSAVISANISNIKLTDAVQQIYDVVEDYRLPPGFDYQLTGQSKEMETSLNSLMMAMVLAVFLVYIVMASQFESLLHPFLILFTIPMALIGVFLTLFVLKIPIGITVYIGMITLVGIVVNNAIILIDYINTLRKRGIEKVEAIKQACAVRLRPILITTFTTVLGLLPMALGLGEGAEIRTPMAISIIAGLLSATFLTLVLIPIAYNKFSK